MIEINTSLTNYSTSVGGVANEFDFYSVAEHETDEILGTSSCIGNATTPPPSNSCGGDIAPADLGRFSAPGTRAGISNYVNGGTAYFSTDGGTTDVADYNNTANGGDYGDWATDCSAQLVQDYEACPGDGFVNITNDDGAEITVLDAVGFNRTRQQSAAEPSSFLLVGIVILAFGLSVTKRRGANPLLGR